MSLNNQDENIKWAKSYAIQALSDLDTREMLISANAAKCHRLHYLQMATEKACKAHLTMMMGHENVRKTHGYIVSNLPIMARNFYANINNSKEISRWEICAIKKIAKEIQVLAPACDDGDMREDNCEYPWDDGKGNIQIPCKYNFPNIDDSARNVVRLIRLIRTAAESYAGKTAGNLR